MYPEQHFIIEGFGFVGELVFFAKVPIFEMDLPDGFVIEYIIMPVISFGFCGGVGDFILLKTLLQDGSGGQRLLHFFIY